MRVVLAGLIDLWCGWTHGGGHIERDPSGRVNWQCNKCGRWATPVPEGEEARMTQRAVEAGSEQAKPNGPEKGSA